MDLNIDGLPLPEDIAPLHDWPERPAMAGVWVGSWNGARRTALIFETVSTDGTATVVYAAAGRQPGEAGFWTRCAARFRDGEMIVTGDPFSIRCRLSETGRLQATFEGDSGFAVLSRRDTGFVTASDSTIPLTVGESHLLDTELVEKGQPVRLETVLFRPPGDGQFPLAVINHGSTGSGDDPAEFSRTWTNPWLAEMLNARGYLVGFPQRRGRGRSDGLYDEGFGEDRARGYSFDPERSLSGADRALEDLDAAILSLRKLPEVRAGPLLLAGNSRGGVLSIAYAGQRPDQVSGVVSFVPGWISDTCPSADRINQPLFRAGGAFPRPILTIFGNDDPYYSIAHCRANHAAFLQAGGRGEAITVSVTGNGNGHWAIEIPPLWQADVEGYLDAINRIDPVP